MPKKASIGDTLGRGSLADPNNAEYFAQVTASLTGSLVFKPARTATLEATPPCWRGRLSGPDLNYIRWSKRMAQFVQCTPHECVVRNLR
jgi:hypothetical protein